MRGPSAEALPACQMLAGGQEVTSGLRQDFFFFPEDLAGSSIHGNSPRAASGSNGISLPSQSRGVGFLFYSSGLGDKGREAHKRRDTGQEGL